MTRLPLRNLIYISTKYEIYFHEIGNPFQQNGKCISTKYEIYFLDEELTFVQPSNFHLSNCAAVVASRVKCIYPPLTFARNPFKIPETSFVERKNQIYLLDKFCKYMLVVQTAKFEMKQAKTKPSKLP